MDKSETPIELKAAYQEKMIAINIDRCRTISLVGLGVMLLITIPFAYPIHLNEFSKYAWYILFDTTLITILVLTFLTMIAIKKRKDIKIKTKNFILNFEVVILFVNCMILSFLDQNVTGGSITVYVLPLMMIAATIYLPLRFSSALFPLMLVAFIMGMCYFQKDINTLIQNIISGTMITGISFFVSASLYKLFLENVKHIRNIEILNTSLEERVQGQLEVILKSEKLNRYLPSQLVDVILKQGIQQQIPTSRKKLTIFFSDVRDFTATTDSIEPEELTEMLNRYFTEMTRIVMKWGGTIDKYIGDAIMVFFGAPYDMDSKEQAERCLKMAIDMQLRMNELHNEWFEMGIENPFEIRTGINTGVVNVGNFGSEDRLSYTIIGGQVNIASRLEAECEPGKILMSHSSYVLVKQILIVPGVEKTISVKGINRPLICNQIDPVVNKKIIEK